MCHLDWFLISNAFKFTKEGHVKVSGRLDDNFIVVNIADTGTGIPNTLQNTIFNEFTQAESTAKSQGYGLGLTIAKKITELLNGSINFTSVENIGTTFVVKIPVETVNTLNLPTTLPTTISLKKQLYFGTMPSKRNTFWVNSFPIFKT